MSELRIKNLREKLADGVLSKACKIMRKKSLNRVPPQVCKIITEKSLDRVLALVYKIMPEKLTDRVLPRACKILTDEFTDRVLLRACKLLTDKSLAEVYANQVLSCVGHFAKYFVDEVVLVACECVTEAFIDKALSLACEEFTDQVLLPEVWELVIEKLTDTMLPELCELVLEKVQERDYIDPILHEACDYVMEKISNYAVEAKLPKAGSHSVSPIDASPAGERQVEAEGAEDPHNTPICPAVSAFDLNVAHDEIHARLQPPPDAALHSDEVALPSVSVIISPTTQDCGGPLLSDDSTGVD